MQTHILARLARAAAPSRAYLLERLSVADFRQEAKRHSLSPYAHDASGNKATLVTRIHHVGNCSNDYTANDASNRSLATAAPHVGSHKPSRPSLDVKLPDLSPLPDTDGAHIPFLPDFWDSSRVRAPDAIHHNPAADSPLPQVLIVAGTRASSPTYNYSHHPDSDDDHGVRKTAITAAENAGFWADVASDLGLPRSSDISASLAKTREAVLSFTTSQDRAEHKSSASSRPLDGDESRGLWILLAIFGGSWLAGGLFAPPKKHHQVTESS